MKRIFRKLILGACVACATFLRSGAQSLEPFSPYGIFSPSVEAWQMTRYGGLTPSLYTGAMTYTLPLYTYSDPDFTIPVSLDYAFDGFRPSQHSGTVGYGWTLNCGGVITREVRGIPDEGDIGYYYGNSGGYNLIPEGWRHIGAHRDSLMSHLDRIFSTRRLASDYIPSSECVRLMQSCDIFADTPGYAYRSDPRGPRFIYDTAPDIYHFRFLGHSGDFVMEADGGIRVFNSDLPHGELEVSIEDSQTQHEYTTITLRTGDGYRYVFYTDGISETPDPDDDIHRPSRHVSAYRLTQIVAPNGRTATFANSYVSSIQCSPRYATMRDGVYNCTSTWQDNCSSGSVQSDNQEKWSIVQERSSSVGRIDISDGGSILFTYATARHDENARKHFTPDSRSWVEQYLPGPQTLLQSVSVENADGEEVERISLSHSYAAGTPKAFLESVSSRRCGTHYFSYNLGGYTLPYSNTRSTDHWGYWNDGPDDDLRRHLVTTGWMIAGQQSVTPDWTALHDTAKFGPDTTYVFAPVVTPTERRVSFHLFDQMRDNAKEPSSTRALCGALTKIEYPTGGSTVIRYEPNSVSRRQNHHCGSSTVDLEPADSLHQNASVVVGGVRVAALDDVSAEGDTLSTSFAYSDGILMQMPRYSEVAHYVHRANSSFASDHVVCTMIVNAIGFSGCVGNPLSFDGHVAYPVVTVTHPDGSTTENRFTSADEPALMDVHSAGTSLDKHCLCGEDLFERTDGVPFSLAPVSTDRRAMRGKPLRTVVRDADGTEVGRTEYTYRKETMSGPMMVYNNLYSYNLVQGNVESPLEQSVVRTEHGITVRELSSYNSLAQKTAHTVIAAGDTTTTALSYLHETDAAALPAAIGSATITRSIDGQGHCTAHEEYFYGDASSHIKPCRIVVNGREHTFTYDSLLRLTGVTLPGNATISYTWDGTHLVRKTENGSHNRTDFEWCDLVGLAAVTGADGTGYRYSYNDESRLSRVKDARGKTVEIYDYNLEYNGTE